MCIWECLCAIVTCRTFFFYLLISLSSLSLQSFSSFSLYFTLITLLPFRVQSRSMIFFLCFFHAEFTGNLVFHCRHIPSLFALIVLSTFISASFTHKFPIGFPQLRVFALLFNGDFNVLVYQACKSRPNVKSIQQIH